MNFTKIKSLKELPLSVHDLIVESVVCENEALILHIRSDDNTCGNLKLKICYDKWGLTILRIRQHPERGRVKLEGQEISPKKLENLFREGKSLEIIEILTPLYLDSYTIKCSIFPYYEGAGEYDFIFFELSDIKEITVEGAE